jgi:hypothetical protein
MLKSGALVAMLPAMALCATLGRSAADEPDLVHLAKGTKAIAFDLPKDHQLPEGAVAGTAVDIVGEISEPIKTGIALLNVRLLSYDARRDGEEQAVTVQLTLTQMEILGLMQKDGAKLRIRLRLKEEGNKGKE